MKIRIFAAAFLTLLFFTPQAFGSQTTAIKSPTVLNTSPHLSLTKEAKHGMERAFSYLLTSQLPNGSWQNQPAITALVLYAFFLDPAYAPDKTTETALNRGLAYILGFVKPNGGIYDEAYRNYVTAVCLMALAESNRPEHAAVITNAKNFLIEFQLDEGENIPKSHPFYGGIGYGGDERPDLSNTQLALDAIKAAEEFEARYRNVIPDTAGKIEAEEAQLGLHWSKALVFLARCQNIKSVNDQPYATDDGGFIYETGTYKPERSQSYGSMTYAGVKSLVYADVSKEDIRVQKAVEWISLHYTLEENPGFGQVSIYYYYMTFGKCLHALGVDAVNGPDGLSHNWRVDLIQRLVSLQKGEGYWVNESGRYWENIKALATAYALIGMKHALIGM